MARSLPTIASATSQCGRPITIDWTFHRESILSEDVRVDLCGPHVLVPEQFLNRPNVCPVYQQVRGKRMPKRVTTSVLLDSQLSNCRANCFLKV